MRSHEILLSPLTRRPGNDNEVKQDEGNDDKKNQQRNPEECKNPPGFRFLHFKVLIHQLIPIVALAGFVA